MIVLAAGAGSRVGAETNKVLLPLGGIPVLAWSLRTVAALEYVDRVVVTTREPERAEVVALASEHLPGRGVTVVAGGTTRHGSEHNALQVLAADIEHGHLEVVAVHDSARPFAAGSLFDAVIAAASEHGGALPGRSRPNLLTKDATSASSEHRALVGVQTPQAFRADALLKAYRRAAHDGFAGTDTASCVERYTDLSIRCVPSPATNLKITYPTDLAVAERLLPAL
ncbi:MAG: 2-C-methyl-D-erythritol 4-phosphate cytidylyltransferase [uncultured Nocardioidaceae bacterium]|uniref:2-C-methyl-D-erythritol 4-phosphate cytidylyltransferase n=1 Tax=uncultured Nocardioidaceae bacterium TaxID=253824 RepID=A0A6J4LXS6_9ACTN|nr:MAG: 2-C-methyl-D-erythritol 4-phosphate cytidylyltransferase [uncultured Nocardioidaceae bacterium]